MCGGILQVCMSVCTPCVPSAGGGQKRLPGPLEPVLWMAVEPPCWFWESNPDSLHELSLHPLISFFSDYLCVYAHVSLPVCTKVHLFKEQFLGGSSFLLP